jgi:hypothetical protein
VDNREQLEGTLFFQRLGQEEPEPLTFAQPRPLALELEAALRKARSQDDALLGRLEELKLENLGIDRAAILPDTRVRLRSERDDDDYGEPLSKRAAGERRKIQIALFLKRSLAEGQTLDDLISHAAKHSLETATLMREVVDSGLLERVAA